MSLIKKLEQLSNPKPVFEDPQDLDFDAVRPQLVDYEDEFDPETSSKSALRLRNGLEAFETDERYLGTKVSRKQLAAFSDESEDDDSLDSDGDSEVSESNDKSGSLKVESENEDRDANSDEEEEDMEQEEAGEDAEIEDYKNKLTENERDNGEETLKTFSDLNLEENTEKGLAVKSQLKLFDSLLECRIKLQKVLLAANQLPQFDVWSEFWESDVESTEIRQNTQQSLKHLLESFIQLRSKMLSPTSEIYQLLNSSNSNLENEDEAFSPDDEEENQIVSESKENHRRAKRKLKIEDYSQHLKKIHLEFEIPKNSIIQNWDDKTKVSVGRLKKSFSGFDQSALQQIQQILSDKDRLISRTQLKRSAYNVLGKKPKEETSDVENDSYHEAILKQDSHLKDCDVEIFDDNDFYHQLLRELIEHKTSDVSNSDALGKQWLEIQKLRSKMKRKVDTRASKGRKLRFDVHPKLTSFMAPIETRTIPEEARKELLNSLFGKSSEFNEEPLDVAII